MSSPHGPAEHKSLMQKHTSPSKAYPLLLNMLGIWKTSLRSFTQSSSECGSGSMQERATILDFTPPAIKYTVSLYAEHKHHTTKMEYRGSLWYKTHFSRQFNCWSLKCSWSLTCRRCSNYIFILHLTLGLNTLRKDNCKPRWKTFKFGIWRVLC